MLLGKLARVLPQVRLQLPEPPGLAQAGDDAQVLAEIVAERAGLFHVLAQLVIAARLDRQHVVLLRQAQIARRFAPDAGE